MDKLAKFLKKISKSDLAKLKIILADIQVLSLENYDIKSLKGEFKGLQRVRFKNIRIVFAVKSNKGYIININFRKDIYK
jgi:mRNA-degrading endonuclease RelE of RelBE toxin-antitoxin system